FVQPAKHFRPPTDLTRPMIMIGPGTGIAPFRAFLEERQATGAAGKNWLFFGAQKAASDFFYREQLEAMQKAGVLTRLSLAFSRDQAEKIYVQTRMLEHAAELWQWLEEGAHFYVCGDASRMAKDVDAALHQSIAEAGGRGAEGAAEYVAMLKKEKRYQRDVY
ncbi:MAG: sulfite reductase subunit alpha, partial [Verrucomicrobia bacterium]|nr:sulfite reductase subunit alpha [Verrucomicrobiota bacterium]